MTNVCGISVSHSRIGHGIRNTLASYLHGIRNTLASYLHGIRNTLASYLHGIRNTLASYLHGIRKTLASYLHGIRNTLASYLHGIRNTLASYLHGIRNTLASSTNHFCSLHVSCWQALDWGSWINPTIDSSKRSKKNSDTKSNTKYFLNSRNHCSIVAAAYDLCFGVKRASDICNWNVFTLIVYRMLKEFWKENCSDVQHFHKSYWS